MLRTAVVLSALCIAAPALAEPMNATQARGFVVGKVFSFTCFEGSVGNGRIFNDGSVAGVVRMQGSGPVRFMHLPPGTLFTKGDAVCSQMKGAFFNPCFNLEKTGNNSFRGAISGFGFAYCDFKQRGRDTMRTASATPNAGDPVAVTPVQPAKPSVRHGRRAAASAAPAPLTAAPIAPVQSEPLKPAEAKPADAPKPAEQPAIRSSIPQ